MSCGRRRKSAPIGSARRGAWLALLLASACAAHGGPGTKPDPLARDRAELLRLQTELAQRDQTIEQLEGRMAMLAASERQLHEQLETMRAESAFAAESSANVARPPEGALRPPAREGARGGSHTGQREAKSEPRLVLGNGAGSGLGKEGETRPLLRLHAERGEPSRREFTSSWTPPTTTERLTVAAVPQLSSVHDRSRTNAPSAATTPVLPLPPVLPVAASPERETSSAADELYVHALDLLRRRELPEALRELDAFLASSPRDGRAARAQFFRGEILYAQRDFARALQAFEQSLLRDPSGDKAPDTLLRIVRCQHQLGAHERARAALQKLRTQFPESEAARAASQVMQEDT